MLQSEDLRNGLQLDMPNKENITLTKPTHIRGPGNKLTYQWLDTDNRCWDETYLLQHGRPRASGAEALTTERKSTHGDWSLQAEMANRLKEQLRRSPGWESMVPMQKEALDMIATKMSRIVCGNSQHDDHWDDIQGYAHLGKGGHT